MMRWILLNPGPVTLSPGVRAALAGPDLCHREEEFAALQDGLRRKLLAVHALDPAQWAAVLLTGSGTAAVEAMLASMVPATGRVLILENGVYGERMRRIAEAYGIDHDVITTAWGGALDLDAVHKALGGGTYSARRRGASRTTTGRLNDLMTRSLRRARGADAGRRREPSVRRSSTSPAGPSRPVRLPPTSACTGCQGRRS